MISYDFTLIFTRKKFSKSCDNKRFWKLKLVKIGSRVSITKILCIKTYTKVLIVMSSIFD